MSHLLISREAHENLGEKNPPSLVKQTSSTVLRQQQLINVLLSINIQYILFTA